jgi:hypothetical protein
MIIFFQPGDIIVVREIANDRYFRCGSHDFNLPESIMSGTGTNGRVLLPRALSLQTIVILAPHRKDTPTHRGCSRNPQLHKNLLQCLELLAESSGDPTLLLQVDEENDLKNEVSNGLILLRVY